MARAAENRKSDARLASLSMGALGIVFGDIGTSPLYAFRACLEPGRGVAPDSTNVLGVLSLVFWALVITVSVKYLMLVLRADNQGEGGILALMELVVPPRKGRGRAAVLTLGIFGAALLYGDGTITPAISVLGAVEGLKTASTAIDPFIVPVAVIILFALFLIQRRGTSAVGRLFGPVMLAWFSVIGILGVIQIAGRPEVLVAVNPAYAVRFFMADGVKALSVLGAVFLTVTGGEALYADLGHLGRRPIRVAWFSLVLPSLLLNYFGQGALVLGHPEAAVNPFYLMAPGWALFPMVALATAATIIASQAVISGVFSLTFQAQQLGFFPRLEVKHTSEEERGQIYMPQVNWILLAATLAVVVNFGSSARLTGAYGVAVSTTMVITTALAYMAFRKLWGWSRPAALAVAGFFMVIDLSFFGANLAKILDGGWYPIVLGVAVYIAMETWTMGQAFIASRVDAMVEPLEDFLARIDKKKIPRVSGTAVYLSEGLARAPLAFVHNVSHNKVIHERVIFVSVEFTQTPYVRSDDRVEIFPLSDRYHRVLVRFGFMDNPNLRAALRILPNRGIDLDIDKTTFFVGRRSLVASRTFGLSYWRDRIYLYMARNAQWIIDYFNLPPDRVFEIGAQIKF